MAEFSKGQRVRPPQLYKTEFPHVGSDKRFGGGLVQETTNNMAKVLWDTAGPSRNGYTSIIWRKKC